jgi:thymidylate synthase (FAD)
MLEHGTVYLTIPGESEPNDIGMCNYSPCYKGDYTRNKYSKVNYEYWEQEPNEVQSAFCNSISRSKMHVTTNYRVLVENGWLEDLKYQCEPTEYHAKRVTVKFVCDRGVSHEFVRHRVFSFAQESTRYCNYSKAKFGNELTFIEPCWEMEDLDRNVFIAALQSMESTYIGLTTIGWKPQQARAILPNSLKTELVMTGFIEDWKHFFELRCDTAAHPQARELAVPLQNYFKENGYI